MAGAFKSKKDLVYDLLRQDIVAGKYKPGTRLVIDELSKQLSISQIPIREAIQQLESDGFVTIQPFVGPRIAEMDAAFIFEVFALLEALEIICGRAASTIMTQEEIETLSSMIINMDDTVLSPEKWSEQNKEMHLFICECARTNLIEKTLKNTFYHWDRLRNYYLRDISGTRIMDAQAEHQRLLTAFLNRDANAVEQILREHNQSALKSYIVHMKAEGHLISQET